MINKNIRGVLLFCILAIVLISQMVVPTGCANPIPPLGGPRDSLPPELVKASPAEHTTDFSSGRITLTFNEYVDLNNYQQNMIVSPLPSSPPTVTRKLNTVTIKLNDTLEPNTTYVFNFNKAIKDVNEGNLVKDFEYVFSTGPYIDSLTFSGKVILAETGKIDTTLTVMLHQDGEDSALYYQRPRYITKVDNKGNFIFRNLSPGTFYVYALKDESGSYRYINKDNLFAFADSAVTISEDTAPVILYAYIEKAKDDNSTATAAAPPSPSRNNRRGGAQADKRLKYQTNLQGGMQDLLQNFVFTFETPLRDFDSSKIYFTTDTTFTPVTGYHWELDSTMKEVKLVYPWKENSLYNFIMEKDFATDTLGQQLLKTDTLPFRTKSASDYGKVSIRLRNVDMSRNPVLVFLQADQPVGSYPLTSETFTSNMFVPGEYTLRVFYDDNKNGKWDPGEFYKARRQPEFVIPLERKFTIRARWSNDFEINM